MENHRLPPPQKPPMTWEEALEKAKVIGEPIIRAARQAQVYDEEEDCGCNEALDFLREGPGTDPNSEVYHALLQPLRMKGVEESESWSIHPPTSIHDKRYEEVDPDANWRKKRQGTSEYIDQWTKYEMSPSAWPQIIDGEVKIATELNRGYNYSAQPFPLTVENPPQYIQHDFNCNWYFTPSINWNHEGYLVWFWQWLVKVPMQARVLNIYHKPFFDGTCSPDGGYALMIQDIEHLPAPRDMSDEQTRLHWHETSAGYVYNLGLKMKELLHTKRKGKVQSKIPGDLQHVFRQMSDPAQEATYLRPAHITDMEGLLRLFSYYARNSTISPYTKHIDGMEVKKVLETCHRDNLPFIVAATAEGKGQQAEERIVGFAYVRDVSDSTSGQNIGDIQVFVSPDSTHKNLGWGLVHRILSILDPEQSRGSPRYDWKPTLELPYYQGSMLPLHKLQCLVAYPPHMKKQFTWTSEWLKRDFGFEEQGVLKAARFKFNQQLDVLYLARHISLPTSME